MILIHVATADLFICEMILLENVWLYYKLSRSSRETQRAALIICKDKDTTILRIVDKFSFFTSS